MGAPTDLHGPDRRSRWLLLLSLGLVVGAGALAFFLLSGRASPGGAELRQQLRDRGRVAVIGDAGLLDVEAEGAQLIPSAGIEGLDAALSGQDEAALTDVLQEAGVGAVLVDGRSGGSLEEGASLAERLRAYGTMESLRGVYLSPVAALYVRRRGLVLEEPLGDVLARAARQIVGGAPTPRLRAFPEPLRRSRNVEVMVMLERDGRARLWRSARGSSIARALVTAGSVARQRWTEREQAMGGPIDDPVRGLPSLTVRVYLLEEDGTLGDRTPAFVERVFTDAHGVAFEDRGSWHYLLPEATAERGEGSAVQAYRELFDDAGLEADALGREDLRVYRLVARELGASEPERSTSDVPPLEPRSPDELLAPLELESL